MPTLAKRGFVVPTVAHKPPKVREVAAEPVPIAIAHGFVPSNEENASGLGRPNVAHSQRAAPSN